MWVQAGFAPDAFWHQSPRLFQLAMEGTRKRLEREAEGRTAQAYESGAFAGLAQHGKLKALKHYVRQRDRKMSDTEMLANMRLVAQRVNRLHEKGTD